MRTLSASILTISLIALIAAPAFAGDDKNKKNDPNQIGDRDVGKCLNFYSVEKEMALGKQLAEEVAREAKVVDDPILSEYVNRIGQNLARNSDAKVPFTFRLHAERRAQCFRAARRIHFHSYRLDWHCVRRG